MEIATGSLRRVTDLQLTRTREGGRRVMCGFGWAGPGTLQVEECIATRGTGSTMRQFRKSGDGWAPVVNAKIATTPVQLRTTETLDTPREIEAFDVRTGRRRIITDLNPQLRALTLGHAEPFAWQDRMGRWFDGTLVFPPGHVPGSRSALVIQEYWYSAGQFVVHGSPASLSAPFAARALANRGLLVLQMDATAPRLQSLEERMAGRSSVACDEEDVCAAVALEGAIDALSAAGLVDPGRVGLVGWSRSGMHVLHAITFSDYPIAAASIADGAVLTPWMYVLTYGRQGGMSFFERKDTVGASFWGEGIKRWQERSPAFHLDRIRSPLRYEHYGTYPPGSWDTFALLKRHSRPVEMIHLPLGTHTLEDPLARHTSQEGNVDWFDFWLNGHEDLDPQKAGQYRRWRKLRELHRAVAQQSSRRSDTRAQDSSQSSVLR
ncbi:MAG: hypothetical protein HC872_07250 [Gammaproteobacteria bacterium]|nr:hypothetical protein [Gammaproteobacteria bacterium]